MTKKYRTMEQFQEIMETVENGNWKDAAALCVEYGFYAQDLADKLAETHAYDIERIINIALLAEMAAKLRYSPK